MGEAVQRNGCRNPLARCGLGVAARTRCLRQQHVGEPVSVRARVGDNQRAWLADDRGWVALDKHRRQGSYAFALPACLLLATALHAQSGSHIGGSQTSNTRVVNSATSTTTSSTSASGSAHVAVNSPAAKAARAAGKSSSPATLKNPAAIAAGSANGKPMNDKLPTDPTDAVQLWPASFKPLVLHTEPCVVSSSDGPIHTRGPVTVDVELDLEGKIDHLDYIGAPDLGAACMEAVSHWTFAPYRYQGRPWRVGSWVRFEFPTPTQRAASYQYPDAVR